MAIELRNYLLFKSQPPPHTSTMDQNFPTNSGPGKVKVFETMVDPSKTSRIASSSQYPKLTVLKTQKLEIPTIDYKTLLKLCRVVKL